jgi:hypothetical protein
MSNIFNWNKDTNNGVVQKWFEDWIFSDVMREKPIMSFDFEQLEYHEEINMFRIDGEPMTEEQKAECLLKLEEYSVPEEWVINVKTFLFKKYLNETDFYVIREIEEGTPIPEAIKNSRAEARASIRAIEDN